jgi:hypothetical protein
MKKGCASILTQPFVFGFRIYSDSYSNNLKKAPSMIDVRIRYFFTLVSTTAMTLKTVKTATIANRIDTCAVIILIFLPFN